MKKKYLENASSITSISPASSTPDTFSPTQHLFRIMAALIPLIHHEKQEPGSMLCAQHALNSLLQGQYFDPSQLSEIAQNLDELEKTQMDEQAWNKRGKDKSSLNMDDTG